MISFSAVEIRRIHRTIVQFLRRRIDKNTPVLFDVPGASLSRHSKSFALVGVGSLVVDRCTVVKSLRRFPLPLCDDCSEFSTVSDATLPISHGDAAARRRVL